MSRTTWRGDLGGALGDLGTLLPVLVSFIVLAGLITGVFWLIAA